MVPNNKPALLALVAVGLVGVLVCVALISNAPTSPAVVELQQQGATTDYFGVQNGPYKNSFIKAPPLQQLAGHDHNPNDNSLRLHLLSKYVRSNIQQNPPKKQQLNGLWERLAYARRVLGSDADEILGPEKRDARGNIIKKHGDDDERRAENSFEEHLRQQRQAQQDSDNGQEQAKRAPARQEELSQQQQQQQDDEESTHRVPRIRQLSRLRRMLKSKFHLDNKREALALAEKNAERNQMRQQHSYEQQQQQEVRSQNDDEDRQSLVNHPGAAAALSAVEGQDQSQQATDRYDRPWRRRAREQAAIMQQQQQQPAQSQQLQQQQLQQQPKATNVHHIHHEVSDDSSQKLVIEGGPITGNEPVAVVGWLHRDLDGDWAGKLYPKNSPQGLAAQRSPLAGGKGWFDGTVTAAQLAAPPAPPPPQPAVVAAPAPVVIEEAAPSELPQQLPGQPTYELSQPMYDVAPTQYSTGSLDPQLNTPINTFEIEPGLQIN